MSRVRFDDADDFIICDSDEEEDTRRSRHCGRRRVDSYSEEGDPDVVDVDGIAQDEDDSGDDWFGQDEALEEFTYAQNNEMPPGYDEVYEENNDDFTDYLTEEQLKEIIQQSTSPSVPKPKDWKEDKKNPMTSDIDSSRRTLWKQAQKEVKVSLDNLGDREVTTLYEKLYGPDSRLVGLLTRKLKIDYGTCCKFLKTFYYAAKNGMTIKQVSEDPAIRESPFGKKLMDKEDYNRLWTNVKNVGGGRDEKYLWRRKHLTPPPVPQ